ncbi:MAG: ribosome small subunit-dependent GTPase A [Megasphaera sp.]|jgi:ribosome biogenesis GTPase|nr:ribosome small subunit-dependent GTPase A [Megasphaera sp.]
MTTGKVIKNYNGYYYVDVGVKELIECRRRGKIKTKILVGDELEITLLGQDKGIIEKALPRRNSLIRPAVANIDQMFIIMAAESPDPNRFLVDKMLMTCEYGDIHPKLVFNKCDLNMTRAEEYCSFYETCGYDVFLVSARTGDGVDALQQLLAAKTTAFAGPSGVGKSSLLGKILGRDDLSVGKVSDKIRRGRHTTRHSEIMRLTEDTYVIDTPGFSALEFERLEATKLGDLFPEMAPFIGRCKFSSCLHQSEPDCAVKDAVAAGKIQQERYETYSKILETILERKR